MKSADYLKNQTGNSMMVESSLKMVNGVPTMEGSYTSKTGDKIVQQKFHN